MNTRLITHANVPRFAWLLLALLSTLGAQLSICFAQGSAFTYQGSLNLNGSPVTGAQDFEFRLFNAATGGAQQGAVIMVNDLGVTNGLFTATLDFGAAAFPGADRWLEIATRPGTNTGAYTTLGPRQPITSTPYALRAANLTGTLPLSQLPSSVVTNNATGLSLTGTFTGNGSGVSNVNAATLGGVSSAGFWRTNGNAGANPTNGAFLGTTDNQPLEFRANGVRGLRIEPVANGAPNFVSGSPSNFVVAGVSGATVQGGSMDGNINAVGGDYGTVSGGRANGTSAQHGTIGGGFANSMGISGTNGTISGGYLNAVIGAYGVVPGGAENTAGGDYAFAAGRRARASFSGSFVWADSIGVFFNATDTNQFLIRAGGGVGINTNNPRAALHVAGSFARVDGAGGEQAYLGGDGAGFDVQVGSFNTNIFSVALWNPGNLDYMNLFAKGGYFTGPVSMSTTNASSAALTVQGALTVEGAIRGGYSGNLISNGVAGGFIGGGGAAGSVNRVGGNYGLVAGGLGNSVNGEFSTVTGGKFNTAATTEATVSGGAFNSALGFSSTIGGGGGNAAGGGWSTIGGGRDNAMTNADYATISGGAGNVIQPNGHFGTIPGGRYNSAASYAFAAGNRAKANHPGAFVWADSTDADFVSSANNQFNIRASGGVGIGTGNPQAALHLYSANNPATLRLQSAGGFGAARLEFFSDPQGSGTEWRPGYIQSTDNGSFTGGLSFHVNGTGFDNRLGDVEVMRIVDGRVGINTPNPLAALQVSGGAYVDFLSAYGVNAVDLASTGDLQIHNSSQEGDHTFTGSLRQMLTLGYAGGGLLTAGYGLGLQTNNFYFRSEADFSWFRGGSHRDTPYDPGSAFFFPGAELMRLSGGYLQVNGSGNEQAYLGGDGAGGDIEIGSRNPAIGAVALWNAGSGQQMDLFARSASFSGNVSFGAQTRQMLNLWGTGYGIGVQASTLYFRCNAGGPNEGFSWYKGGTHNDGYANPGGGTELMHLVAGGLYVNGAFVSSSDRNAKENLEPVDTLAALEKVVALPLSEWNYKSDTGARHIGPMAQDFRAAFGLGHDDKGIATVDADGVALAAIQGLNRKVESENSALRAENAGLKKRLERLERLIESSYSTR